MDQILPSLNNLPVVREPVWRSVNEEQFKEIIDESHGIISLIVVKYGWNYRQIYNALDHWKLRDYMLQAKNALVAKAENVLVKSMESQNEGIALRAAETVLKSEFARQNGWQQSPQVAIQQNIVSAADKKTAILNIFGITADEEPERNTAAISAEVHPES